jgi:hypothetical protein
MHDAVADGGDVFRMEGEGVAEQAVTSCMTVNRSDSLRGRCSSDAVRH